MSGIGMLESELYTTAKGTLAVKSSPYDTDNVTVPLEFPNIKGKDADNAVKGFKDAMLGEASIQKIPCNVAELVSAPPPTPYCEGVNFVKKGTLPSGGTNSR